MSYRVRIMEDAESWTRQHVRLLVFDKDNHAVLNRDGSWTVVPEGASIADSGVPLPTGVIEPLAAAIAEWQGHTNHADTEARVLREWLAVERARVDRVLAASPPQQVSTVGEAG